MTSGPTSPPLCRRRRGSSEHREVACPIESLSSVSRPENQRRPNRTAQRRTKQLPRWPKIGESIPQLRGDRINPPVFILFFVDFKGYRTSTFYSFWSKELGQKKIRCKNLESFFWEKKKPLGYLEVENSTIHTGLHPWTLTWNPKDPGGLAFGRWFSFSIRWFWGSKCEFSEAQWNQPIKTVSIRYQ